MYTFSLGGEHAWRRAGTSRQLRCPRPWGLLCLRLDGRSLFAGFAILWLVDGLRIPDLVNEHNREAWDLHFQTLMDGGDFELDESFEALGAGEEFADGGGGWGP